jgi:hypothetical protein
MSDYVPVRIPGMVIIESVSTRKEGDPVGMDDHADFFAKVRATQDAIRESGITQRPPIIFLPGNQMKRAMIAEGDNPAEALEAWRKEQVVDQSAEPSEPDPIPLPPEYWRY